MNTTQPASYLDTLSKWERYDVHEDSDAADRAKRRAQRARLAARRTLTNRGEG